MAYIPPFLSNSVRLRPLQFPSSPPAEQAAGSDYCPAWVLVNSLLLSFARAGVARQIVRSYRFPHTPNNPASTPAMLLVSKSPVDGNTMR